MTTADPTITQTQLDSDTVVTSISFRVKKAIVKNQLQDFESLIRINPLVKSVVLQSDSNASFTYRIVDQLKVFCVPLSQTYTATFTMQDNGLSVLTDAGKWVRTSSEWVIEDDLLDPTKVRLSETSKVKCPWILRGYVISQIKSSHLDLFGALARRLVGLEESVRKENSAP